MPSIDLEIFDHVVFLVLAVLLPWNARRRFRLLAGVVEAGDMNARMRSYRTVVVEKWALALVIVVAWIVLGRSASSLGFTFIFNATAITGYAFTALAIGALSTLARSAVDSDEGRRRTGESIASLRPLLPQTASEKQWFDAVSVSAGICEELSYRGFLFAYLASWFSGSPEAVVIVLAGLIFGLGHLYQGVAGIVKTGVLGTFFGLVYWMTGSLWAPMLLHAFVDLNSGWISWQVIRQDDLDEPAAL